MNGLQLTLWVSAVALVLWHWRHEGRSHGAPGPASDVTTMPRDNDDYSE